MPPCPSCQSEVVANALRCQRCGAAMGVNGANGANGATPEFAALELGGSEPPPAGAAAAKRPPPARLAPTSPTAKGKAAHAVPLRAAGKSDLEIDLTAEPEAAGLQPGLQGQGSQSKSGLRIGPDGQLIPGRANASTRNGSRAGLDEDGLDPYEVRAFADYGDVPQSFYLLPLYSLRVRQRDAELRDERDRRSALVRESADRIGDMVIAFGERVRPIAAANPIYVRAVAPIVEAERLLVARDGGLAAETDAYKKTTSALDEKLGSLEAELHRIAQESAALEAELEKLEDARKRSETKSKRIEIEIRNAEAGLAAGQGEGASLKLHVAEKKQVCERERAAAASLAPLITAQSRKLDVPRAARAGIERELDGIRRQRIDAEQRLKRQTGTREAGVEDARKKARDALAEFSRTALSDASTFGGEFDASRRAIEMLLRERADRELSVLMVDKALACADRAAVKRGYLVTLGGVLTLLLLVLGKPIYRVFVPVQAPSLYPVDE